MINVKGSEHITWSYPEIYKEQDTLTVSLMHTRAADDIKIYFDSNRNGYVILMDKTKYIDDEGRSEVIKENEEVAFVPAWNEE